MRISKLECCSPITPIEIILFSASIFTYNTTNFFLKLVGCDSCHFILQAQNEIDHTLASFSAILSHVVVDGWFSTSEFFDQKVNKIYNLYF